MNLKKLCLITLASLFALSVGAQERSVNVSLRGGYNAVHEGFSAVTLSGNYGFDDGWALCGGVQYSTIGRTAVELRPAYLYDVEWATLSARGLVHYAGQNGYNNLAAGVGVGLERGGVFCTLGYYYRTILGGGGRIDEPVNFFYELGVELLPNVEKWALQLIFTNSELCDLERQYQPSWIVRTGWQASENLGLTFDVNYKAAGMFNMSTDFYQLFIQAGLCYRW
ncbi:MAG: hypothetical protein IKU97_00545 [Tidjanibacter sp.]|nr:hypothetical protein [Tidjanibacter sp.]